MPAASVFAQQTSYTFSLATDGPTTVSPGTNVVITGEVCPNPSPDSGVKGDFVVTAPNGTRLTATNVQLSTGSDICIYPTKAIYFQPNDTGTWTVSGTAYWTQGGYSYSVPASRIQITVQAASPPPSSSTTPHTSPGTYPATQPPQEDYTTYWLTAIAAVVVAVVAVVLMRRRGKILPPPPEYLPRTKLKS